MEQPNNHWMYCFWYGFLNSGSSASQWNFSRAQENLSFFLCQTTNVDFCLWRKNSLVFNLKKIEFTLSSGENKFYLRFLLQQINFRRFFNKDSAPHEIFRSLMYGFAVSVPSLNQTSAVLMGLPQRSLWWFAHRWNLGNVFCLHEHR